MGDAVEHYLVAAEGRLGVPDDVLEDLVHGVAAHRELGAPRIVCRRVEVLDGEMEVPSGSRHIGVGGLKELEGRGQQLSLGARVFKFSNQKLGASSVFIIQ